MIIAASAQVLIASLNRALRLARFASDCGKKKMRREDGVRTSESLFPVFEIRTAVWISKTLTRVSSRILSFSPCSRFVSSGFSIVCDCDSVNNIIEKEKRGGRGRARHKKVGKWLRILVSLYFQFLFSLVFSCFLLFSLVISRFLLFSLVISRFLSCSLVFSRILDGLIGGYQFVFTCNVGPPQPVRVAALLASPPRQRSFLARFEQARRRYARLTHSRV